MISIFTPTYNRANKLPQLFNSLLNQSLKEFEWIIVDDGSSDDTKTIVDNWINNDSVPFKITYIHQENAGKHIAINTGVSHAKYEWFFIVDSDDFLTDNAVEIIHKWLKEDIPDRCAAISGTKKMANNKIIGGEPFFVSEYFECKNNERIKYRLDKDKAEIYKTEILKKYKFKQFGNEKFLSECSVFDLIASDGYYIRWYKEPLMVCEYLEGGLTSQLFDIEQNNFEGFTYSMQVKLKAYKGIYHYRIVGQYIKRALLKNFSIKEIATRLGKNYLLIFMMTTLIKALKLIKN